MIPFHRAAEKGALAYPISCNLALACGNEMQFNQLKRREFITLLGGAAGHDAHGRGCVNFALRCVKYLTHWHGTTAPASHMLAASGVQPGPARVSLCKDENSRRARRAFSRGARRGIG
jgi:hypothetical protein